LVRCEDDFTNLQFSYRSSLWQSKKEEKTMTKAELVEQMAEDAAISKAEAAKALDSLIDGIAKALTGNKGRIVLTGFGTFSRVARKAREGINPATGEKIRIEARNAITFKPSKTLKDAMA
jgi:DNA-binding protein HU-beta